ncbi:MAG: flippase-like domain-containing protein [Deltaproteobacteria bacterium]|nr:flippase-like domain-containing protein [Deltaproteobacteria bacterium]
MQSSHRKALGVLGILISVALLCAAFWDVDVRALVATFKAAEWPPLLGVVALNLGMLGVRGWRWRAIIAATEALPLTKVVLATTIGHMANNFLPARGGELVRVLVLAGQTGASKAMLLGSLVVDHTLEGLGLVLVMLGLPLMFDTPVWLTTITVTLASITVAAIGVGLVVMALGTAGRSSRLWLPGAIKPRVERLVGRLGEGFETLHDVKRTLAVVAIGLCGWIVQGVMVYLCFTAMHIELDLAHALFVLAAINVAVMIPGAPSGVGTFEFATVVALGAFGVAKTPALSLALVYHFAQIIPTVLVGLASLPAVQLRLADLTRAEVATGKRA